MDILKKALVILIFMSIMAACSKGEPIQTENLSTYGDLLNRITEQGMAISISTDQETYKMPVNQIMLTIENTGNGSVEFGPALYLEKFQNNEWHQIPYKDFTFGDEGLGIELGEIYEEDVPLD
ncbi:hypothetical protein B0H99_10334 [Planomicrobium soli]|uniref:Bacterial Ig-like domain-containing protein n=1 Tax=Planomicrobium soli TaxID=1176648 RepID=A0A2P8H3V6_9BACL|nr:immunoglobulin-like domain-containing protein [Planomicrobium soli]PSL40902.1 hypothetical protein B0H99_10334 [Planomicrobium soli]